MSKPISCTFTDAPLSCSIGAGTEDMGGDGASREGPGELVGVVEKSRRLLGLHGLEGAVRVAPLIPKLRVSVLSTPRDSSLPSLAIDKQSPSWALANPKFIP
jgi:hypothetical protein